MPRESYVNCPPREAAEQKKDYIMLNYQQPLSIPLLLLSPDSQRAVYNLSLSNPISISRAVGSVRAATMKDAGDHGYCRRRRIIRRTFFCILLIIILILLAILIVWLVLRPTKPRFYLQDARVLSFNLSAPNLLSSTLQITISSRNPNDRIGIYYDRLDVYASYKNQQITPAYSIPSLYQGHKDIDVWSPYLSGSFIPIAPYLCTSLTQDEAGGFLFLYIKIDGRLRWKVGSWTSSRYHLFVECPAFLTFDDHAGVPVIRFQQMSTCSVSV